jgi:hypothetical protein
MSSLSLRFSVRAITACCLQYAYSWNSGNISVLFIHFTKYTTESGTRIVGNFITCNTYFDWGRRFGIISGKRTLNSGCDSSWSNSKKHNLVTADYRIPFLKKNHTQTHTHAHTHTRARARTHIQTHAWMLDYRRNIMCRFRTMIAVFSSSPQPG